MKNYLQHILSVILLFTTITIKAQNPPIVLEDTNSIREWVDISAYTDIQIISTLFGADVTGKISNITVWGKTAPALWYYVEGNYYPGGPGNVAIGGFNDFDQLIPKTPLGAGQPDRALTDFSTGLVFSSGIYNHPLNSNTTSDYGGGGDVLGRASGVVGFGFNDIAGIQFTYTPAVNGPFKGTAVFASEEYEYYIDGGFNDGAKVFISTDGGTTNTNIYTAADGRDVRIDNVNPGDNLVQYIGNDPQYNQNYYAIEPDGWTVPIQFSTQLVAGTTYTISIFMGDDGDSWWNSWFYFPAGSFSLPDLRFDRGDAPASYGEAVHNLIDSVLPMVPDSIMLGANVSHDSLWWRDGIDNSGTASDDTYDDGVASLNELSIIHKTYVVDFTYTNILSSAPNANVAGWVDFDRNGTFDADEYTSIVVSPGTGSGTLTWSSIPLDIMEGITFVRLRISTNLLSANEAAVAKTDGEVEDYQITITLSDSPFRFWFKADAGIGTGLPSDGQNVDHWVDQSGNSYDVFTDTLLGGTDGDPFIYKESGLNFNPTLTNPDNTSRILGRTSGLTLQLVYVVTIPDNPPLSNTVLSEYNDTTSLHNIRVGSADPTRWASPPSSTDEFAGTTGSSWYNGLLSTNPQHNDEPNIYTVQATSLDTIADGIELGDSYGAGNYWTGQIAEVIGVAKGHSDVERNIIESYLAIKYGITLNNSGAIPSYNSSDTTVIWDNSVPAYWNDVAGIGQDTVFFKLIQKQSKSVNSDAIITMGLDSIATHNLVHGSSFDTDKSFLVWGNNDGDLTTWSKTEMFEQGGGYRLAREWLVKETNNVKEVELSVNIADIPAVPPYADVYLMVDKDGDFSLWPYAGYKMTKNDTEGTYSVQYDFVDGDYFTIIYIIRSRMRQGKHFLFSREKPHNER